jgi:glutathione synthase/RimK-type ligase-like ATP-grasp enzyme
MCRTHHGHIVGHGHGHRREPDGEGVIAIVIEGRHLGNRAVQEARAALKADGFAVHLVVPAPGACFDIPAEAPLWDAVVSRGRHPAVLSLLSAAAALGVPAVNPPRAIDLVRNKVAMQAVLARHDMPLPRAWFASDPSAFAQVPREHYPLVVKPFDGDGSAGLFLLAMPEDVALLLRTEGHGALYVAQEYLEADGWDLKLYGIGSNVWAVRKPAPVCFDGTGPGEMQETDGAELVDCDAQLRDIALTCGRACGLELWGVDVAITADGPYVIEVNDFPTYSAVPDAGAYLARHIVALSRFDAVRRQSGQERMRSLLGSVS